MLVVAVWFRCHDLGSMPGINGDEAWYGVQAEMVLHGEPISWHTPTGNLLNPLFFGPQLLLHACFEPSFALLRTTALLSGLLALVVNYWLCRDVFGCRAALISTTILAVLPIDIVYSRLAWDACQSLLSHCRRSICLCSPIGEPRRRNGMQRVRLGGPGRGDRRSSDEHLRWPLSSPMCLAIAWRDETACRLEFADRRGSSAFVGFFGVGRGRRPSWRSAVADRYGGD